MSTEVFLIRHAESAMNLNPHLVGGQSNETPLSELGEQQASSLGHYLLRESIVPSDVQSSTAQRATSTAEISLRTMGLHIPVQLSTDLLELDMGQWEKQPRIEIYTDDVLKQINWLEKDFAPPGGESMNDVSARMLRWLHRIPDDDGVHFAYTHGLAIRCLMSGLFDWSREDIRSTPTENTSLTHLVYDGKWLLEDFAKIPN